MRIGHYAPKIEANGGIATYIRRAGEAQTARGHDVAYLGRGTDASSPDTYRVPDDAALFAEAEALGLDVLHLHKSVETLPPDRVPTVRTMHGHQGGCPSASRYLARTGEPCDRSYSVPGCLWGHVVDRCGSVRPQNLIRNFSRVERELNQARRIPTYTVSNFLRNQMVRAGCPSDQLQTIHSPAPQIVEDFPPLPRTDPPRFLYVGRIVPEKGLAWLLRAFAEVSPPAQLEIAGKGPQLEEMKTLARELSVQARVTFHGWVKSSRVSTLIRNARAVVFPSLWHEPAGLVTLEAAAIGRPVIASAVGGIPEYARNDHALLVEPRDLEGMADALSRLARAPDRAADMGRRGFDRAAEDFSMADFLDDLHAFYDCAFETSAEPDPPSTS